LALSVKAESAVWFAAIHKELERDNLLTNSIVGAKYG
jgi:hypothetical protein